MRIALAIEYQGTAYCGWQRQPDVSRTVEEHVQTAASFVANEPIALTCAGRTDSGVHACAQWVHFDTTAHREPYNWVLGVNSRLPEDIRVLHATRVADDFHARYKATARRYRYLIYTSPVKTALLRNQATWERQVLSVSAMHTAAQALVGEHDFTAFRSVNCQARTPVRNLQHISVTTQGPFIVIDVMANAFLHHMVRNIAGVLMAVGRADAPVSWAKEVLEGRNRTLGGITAPPEGLYLVQVHYPECWKLPKIALGPAFFMEEPYEMWAKSGTIGTV